MKLRLTSRLAYPLASAIAALLAGLAATSVEAATFYWDANGATIAYGSSATGTWAQNSTTTGRWVADAEGDIAGSATQATTNADVFNFGSATHTLGAGTITVSGGVTMGSTNFNSTSGAIVLTGSTITYSAAPVITVNNTTNTISSIIAGAATSFTKAGSGILVLNGANTYAGSTIINAGTINLGGGTGTGSLASTTLTLGGGSFSYTRTGTNTQTFATTNINGGGAGQISVVSGNTLNLGTVTRGVGAALDFSTTGAGTVAAVAASNTNGIMAGLTVGNSWAVANGAGLAISGLAGASYTLTSVAGTTAASYLNGNIDVNDNSGAPAAAITPNSLRFSTNAANTLTLATGTNTISSGGILVGSAVGSNLSTITGGTLTGIANRDLTIIQNNTSGGLTVSSSIVNTTSTSVTKSGAGLLTLDANNTFTGGLTINGGKVQINNAGALNSTAGSENAVTFGSGATGTLTLNGNSVILRSLNTNAVAPGAAVVENANVGNITLTIGNAGNANSAFAGVIQNGTGGGTLALRKSGAGTLTLSGANTYTGGTELTAGTVVIGHATAFGASTGLVSVTGGSRINATGGLTYANAINVGAPLTLQIPSTTPGTATFSGQLTGSSPITVVATGVNAVVGTYAFTNANNTFTGNILMPTGSSGSTPNASGNDFFSFNSIGDGGNITFQKFGHSNAVAYAGSAAITFDTRQIVLGTQFGGFFDGGGVNPVNYFQNNATNSAHTVTFNTNITPTTINQTGSSFFFGGSNTGDNTFSGTISNPTNFNLGIGKADAGRWILTGANSSYLGNVTIANGTLAVNAIDVFANNQPLGKGSLIQLGNSSTSGILEFIGSANSSTDKQVVLGLLTNNNQVGAGGIVNNSATGTLTFSNPTFNSIIGATVTTVTRNLTLGGSNTGANTISGTIQNNATNAPVVLNKTGTGTWVLSGANSSYTGATTIQAGTLVAGANAPSAAVGAFGNTNSAIVLGNASTLAASAPTLLINGAFTVGRAITVGSVANTAAYNATIGGSNTTGTSVYTGNITLSTTATNYTTTLQAATGGTVQFITGTWTTNNKPVAIGSADNTGTVILSNAITTSGGISVNHGTLALNSTFTGGMTVASGATLSGTGSVSGTTAVTGGTVNGTGLVLTGATTFNSSGNILSGTVTSTAGVTVSSGAVLANDGTLTGTVGVSSTGTLKGSGAITGALTVGANGVLAPGNSIESLAAGSLSMAASSTFEFEVLDNSATGADLLAVGTTVSLTGVTLGLDPASTAALSGGGWNIGDKLTLISYLGADITSGFTGFLDDTAYLYGLNSWLFNYNDTDAGDNYALDAVAGGQNRFVTLTIVPEPSAALLGGLGLLALLRRRR